MEFQSLLVYKVQTLALKSGSIVDLVVVFRRCVLQIAGLWETFALGTGQNLMVYMCNQIPLYVLENHEAQLFCELFSGSAMNSRI